MFEINQLIVFLWLLPVTIQIIVPLVVLLSYAMGKLPLAVRDRLRVRAGGFYRIAAKA